MSSLFFFSQMTSCLMLFVLLEHFSAQLFQKRCDCAFELHA